MKILLQINAYINSGSTGRIAEEIGQLAVDNGWESYIAYARNDRMSQSKKIKIGNKFDIYWHVLMTRLFDRHGLCSNNATNKLIKQIKQINPDIIHLHNIHGYYLNYKILFHYLKESGIPVVWTLHDCWTFTGHCVYFTYMKCDKWKDHCFNCPQKKTYPSGLFIDRSRKNYIEKKKSFLSIGNKLTLVPVSDWLAGLCSQSFFRNVSIKRIHNGIDINTFKPLSEKEKMEIFNKYNITTRFFISGVANVWSARKGLNDFIKLRSILSEEYSILLVGLSKKQILSLPQGIIGLSKTEHIDELAKIYASSEVFINPTWEDNFPTTNLEALSCGTPVITYNTGGSIEAVIEETGFIVEQGDIQGLKNAIEKIKKNGKIKYSLACRKRALDFFRKEDKYIEYIQLYEKLLSGK
jgi:glycosyltransferase involved in cell wall biosynthesis